MIARETDPKPAGLAQRILQGDDQPARWAIAKRDPVRNDDKA